MLDRFGGFTECFNELVKRDFVLMYISFQVDFNMWEYEKGQTAIAVQPIVGREENRVKGKKIWG